MAQRTDTPRQIAAAKTRAALLSAARDLWAEPGTYEAVTIRQIARRAGVSTGAIFAHFEDKASIWRDAMGYAPPVDCEAVRAVLQAEAA